MYIDDLTYPHPTLQEAGQPPEPLIEAAGVEEAREYVAHAQDADAATLEVVGYFQQHVHRALRFPKNADMVHLASGNLLDTLTAEQVTNCIGYTIVGSELLSRADIEHYTAYANQHFFTVVPVGTANRRRLRAYDMLTPSLNQDMTNTINASTVITIETDIRTQQRSCALLNMSRFAGNLWLDVEQLSTDNPWLTRSTGKSPSFNGSIDEGQERTNYLRKYTSVMTIYEAQTGRDVMTNYIAFHYALRQGQYEDACHALTAMRCLYPEVDIHGDHNGIMELVTHLAIRGQTDDALVAINDYCSSLAVSKHPGHKLLEGRLYETLSRKTEDIAVAGVALYAYRQARERTRRSSYPRPALDDRIRSMLELIGI